MHLRRTTARHLASQTGAAPEELQATLPELTATPIVESAKRVSADLERLVICGGSAYNNTTLISPFDGLLSLVTVEAIGSAWFTRPRVLGQPANVPDVTGARQRVRLGGVYSGYKDND